MPLFSFEGKTPRVDPTAWIAPTATLIGDVTVEAGAPDWLHLVAVVLAWDAIKIGWLSILSCIRRVIYGAREVARRLT